MPYVQRENGVVIGTYYGPLEGVAEEFLPDDNPEVVSFLNPPPPPPTVSRRQFFQQAAIGGIISESEALAAVTTGALPAPVMSFIGSLPVAQQFGAKMLFAVNEFNRTSPLANAFGDAIGMTPEQIDAFFEAASQL